MVKRPWISEGARHDQPGWFCSVPYVSHAAMKATVLHATPASLTGRGFFGGAI